MPTAIFDSSLLTKQRQQKANYTYSNTVNQTTVPGTVRSVTTNNPSQEVLIDVRLGACRCNAPIDPRNGCTCGPTNF